MKQSSRLIYRIEVIDNDSLEAIYQNESEIPEVARMILESAIDNANKYQEE